MQDEATTVSTLVAEQSHVIVLVTTRSGQAQVFKYQPNGRTKPLKPSLNIAIASDVNQKESIQQIPILAGQLTKAEKLLLAYGTHSNLTFEQIVPDFSDKVQCLIRSEMRKSKEKKEESVSKVKTTAMDGDVEYLAPGNVSNNYIFFYLFVFHSLTFIYYYSITLILAFLSVRYTYTGKD